MSNNIQLSATMRMNLYALQNTANAQTSTSRLSTGKKVNTMIAEPVKYLADISHNSRRVDLGLSEEGLNQKISELTSMLGNASASQTQEQKAAQSLVTDSSLEVINKLSQTSQGSSQKLLDGAVNFNLGAFKGINTLV